MENWVVDRPAVIETSLNSPSVEVVGRVYLFGERGQTRHCKLRPMEYTRFPTRRANAFAPRCFKRVVWDAKVWFEYCEHIDVP